MSTSSLHVAKSRVNQLDKAAIWLSGLCLVHCLAIPFAIVLGPALGNWLADTETEVHWMLLAAAAPLSLWALGRGYLRHRSIATISLGVAGLAMMLIGVTHLLGADMEIVLTAIGVSLVLVAHVRNLRAHAHS